MKTYADNKANVKPSDLSVGDTVLVRRDPSEKKSESPYKHERFIVTEKKGSMITATTGNRGTTRNSSFFKQIPEDAVDISDSDDDSTAIPSADVPQDTNNNHQANNAKPTPATTRRYPRRNRRPPEYLKDYVATMLLEELYR